MKKGGTVDFKVHPLLDGLFYLKGSDILKKKPAILIIHGLGEGIEDNENFFNFIQSTHKFDVYMFTLPGSNRKNRIKGYHDWLDIAEENISKLEKEYENIYIVGHSMGAVISCFLASLHNVKKIVLVAPAFGFLNLKQNFRDIKHKFEGKPADVPPDSKIFYDIVFSRILSVPLRSYKNFLLFTHKYKNCVRYVKCDALIIYGTNDEIVPKRSVDYAYNLLASKNKIYLEYNKVGHVVFQSNRKDEINNDIYNFLIGGEKWIQQEKRKK